MSASTAEAPAAVVAREEAYQKLCDVALRGHMLEQGLGESQLAESIQDHAFRRNPFEETRGSSISRPIQWLS